jgi:branched-chain amino acid transport system permease protein
MTIIWAGIAVGSLYALVAVLFNVILAQTGLFSFASAQPLMIGSFVAYSGMVEHGLPSAVVVILGLIIGGVLGFAVERIAIRPLIANRPLRGASFSVLVTSLGASFVIQGIAIRIWGSETRSVPFPGGGSSFRFLGGILQPIDVALMAMAAVVAISLELATHRTAWGIAGRATTEDEQAAALRGVNIRRVATAAFVISGAIAGALGPVASAKTSADVGLGTSLLVYAFVALAIGGYGSYLGCLIGGLITGVIQLEVARYASPNYSLIILLALVLCILLVRPTGLMGVRGARFV